MIAQGEIGPKPVEYLVLAWLGGIGSAVLLTGLIAPVVVAYLGGFDGPLGQKALVGLLIWPLVIMTQFVVASAFCAAILHSRSVNAAADQPIGTGHRNSNIVVALPFETTAWSRFWVAMHRSGWRVYLAIYAVILAIIVTSAAQNYVIGALLLVAAVALGAWHASHLTKKTATDAVDAVEADTKRAASEKAQIARERKAARDREAAQTRQITDEWIDAELKKASTATAVRAIQQGDHSRLDVIVGRAHVALAERVAVDELRERALAWAARQNA